MRNLLGAIPTRDLHGGQLYARSWVSPADIAGQTVLDIGCGFGWFELLALDGGVKHITGIEPTEADLETVRGFFAQPEVSIRAGSAIDLPFEDDTFNTVVCWEVLEHIPRGTEPEAFAEIARVLRPGGVFYMSTPHAEPLHTVLDPAWWLVGHRHYPRDRVRRLAAGAAMEVTEIHVRGDGWVIVYLLNLYVAKWIFRRAPFFEASIIRRVDSGYMEGQGRANLFMKCVLSPAR